MTFASTFLPFALPTISIALYQRNKFMVEIISDRVAERKQKITRMEMSENVPAMEKNV